MIGFRTFRTKFLELQIGNAPVIVHSSLSAFLRVQGGAETVVGALTDVFTGIMAPTFTYQTMVTPKTGPPDNGITYGSGDDANRMAQFFEPEMPASPLMGVIAETVRQHPAARRSNHPIYSFAGINVEAALKTQTLENPFGPIRALTLADGWVLLLGVDHTSNTSIHYAEMVAGRRQFIRWALTPQGVIECPGWPGCSYGFNQIAPRLTGSIRTVEIGPALVQAMPLQTLVIAVKEMLAQNPNALLCTNPDCERCAATRQTRY